MHLYISDSNTLEVIKLYLIDQLINKKKNIIKMITESESRKNEQLKEIAVISRGGFNVRQTRQTPKVKNEEIKKKKIGILRVCSISYLSHPWE